ncbi:beta-eliminating lyase-related protein [Luteimonas sp. MC1572]|uniref:threonine aldolase family protein n=1 Tax=Luteimonas sp. MC1572 TaxID=2799325 RepID=UPI0018F0C25A|nr:beta-eliminating lyase-related protein [Luteimonas sp. MC1572]MBJ6980911.1 DegT/DnrJ/EryC1/StrS family aminotransferase [Luteimonas sp. MC1572]QQO02267.1 DegT/DnrJ/EryC1/StrS family aminotransferase [Luteimonas sp. MC1572]
MDRRRFLGVSGVAAASPMLAALGAPATANAATTLFKRVNFASDGLGLSPAEYAALLGEVVAQDGFEPDYYSQGGAIRQLERKFAKLLGKDDAIYLPTGTLANHLALRKLAGDDRRVLVQAESHLYNDSGDCAQTLSGLNLVPLAEGGSTLPVEEVERWLARSSSGRVETRVGVIAIESPVRRRHHEMADFDALKRVSNLARERGIRLHLDGARMFNLPLHSGQSLHAYSALFDTVYVSLWKHFNAASGAILAGDAAFIDGLFHQRRMFGGALPHAWPEAAVALRFVDGYLEDYAKSWQVADRLIALLQDDRRFSFEKLPRGTSRFFMTMTGVAPELFRERLAKQGVVLSQGHPDTGRFAMEVNASLLRVSADALAGMLINAAVIP